MAKLYTEKSYKVKFSAVKEKLYHDAEVTVRVDCDHGTTVAIKVDGKLIYINVRPDYQTRTVFIETDMKEV